MGFWRKVCYVIAIVMIAGGQPLGQLQKSIANKRDWKHSTWTDEPEYQDNEKL